MFICVSSKQHITGFFKVQSGKLLSLGKLLTLRLLLEEYLFVSRTLESKQTLLLSVRSVGPDDPRSQQSKKSSSWTSMKTFLWGCSAQFLPLEIQGEADPLFFIIGKLLMIQRVVGRQKLGIPSTQSPLKKLYRFKLPPKFKIIIVYCMKFGKHQRYKELIILAIQR